VIWHRAALLAALLAAPAMTRAATCTVSATPVAFGVYLPFSGTPTSITGAVTVSCDAKASVVVALSTGGGGSYANRQMSKGANMLRYQLYTDAAHSLVWGDGTAGTVTVSATVAGNLVRTLTVYGQVPALQAVASLTYIDAIMVTVTY